MPIDTSSYPWRIEPVAEPKGRRRPGDVPRTEEERDEVARAVEACSRELPRRLAEYGDDTSLKLFLDERARLAAEARKNRG
jgi:hypothetical protein